MSLYSSKDWAIGAHKVINDDSFTVTLTIEDWPDAVEETDEERFINFVHEAQEYWLALQREALPYHAGGAVE